MSLHGLLGRTLGHSFSPPIHAMLWGCEDYRLLPMEPEEARAFLLKKEYDWLNVTIPYKTLALELCDVVHPHAAAIGAVNTVLNRDGVLCGYNTDFVGMRSALAMAGIALAGKKVLVLGSGGTSLTARAVAAAEAAAQVVVISRSGPDNYSNLEKHADAQVIINTTPVGMYPHGDEAPLSLEGFPALEGVLDAVYNPLATPLVQAARARGIPAAGGLAMLVEQGRAAAEHFSGAAIPHEKGLLGHSDADVLLHAISDALLGAAALGDIGKHFPDTDPEYKDADSLKLLARVGQLLEENNYFIENIDATIIAQQPKMRPHIDKMRENIAGALGIEVSQVNVKATTEEGLGFTGAKEGISSQAICMLISPSNLVAEDVMARGCEGCPGCKAGK